MAIGCCARNLTLLDGGPVNFVFERLLRLVNGMALHACRIRVRLVELRQSMPRSAPIVGVIIPNVPHSAHFGEHCTEHAVIRVANVATLVAEIRILAMNRRKRRAVRILRIIRMVRHGMARGAKFSFRRYLEIRHIASHRRSDRQRSKADEQP